MKIEDLEEAQRLLLLKGLIENYLKLLKNNKITAIKFDEDRIISRYDMFDSNIFNEELFREIKVDSIKYCEERLSQVNDQIEGL